MNRTLNRIKALERQALVDHSLTVWQQASDGSDTFTSKKHPGLTLTRETLMAREEPQEGLKIVVLRIDSKGP